MNEFISEIVAEFETEGVFQSSSPIESGHIHTTLRVETRSSQGARHYLLQQVNTQVFRDPASLMRNIVLVTSHLRQRLITRNVQDIERRVLQVVPTKVQQPYFVDGDRNCWRLFDYVSGAYVITDDPKPGELYEAAYAFGEFIALLADLPQQQLTESIPNFHHGPSRYLAFQEAVRENACGRVARAHDEIELIEGHHFLLAEPQRLIEERELPLRVTHNDTKSNNVLLDTVSQTARCVIDLDTVMPGLALYDFGDFVRTTATGVAEDERDLDKVKARLPHIEHAMRGFIAGSKGHLSPQEVQSLLIGPPYMALIMATRFLTDFLRGDTYYRIQHADHNLARCRTQLALVQSLQASRDVIASFSDQIATAGGM